MVERLRSAVAPRRAGRRLRAPVAAGDAARVRPLISAVADAGLRDEDDRGAMPRATRCRCCRCRPRRAREFDHVFVLGLQSARMPGARRAPARADPRGTPGETLRPRRAHRTCRDATAAARGDDPRARGPRARLCGAHRPRRAAAAVAVRRGGARRARRRMGGPRGGALRARRVAARDLPGAARRAARGTSRGPARGSASCGWTPTSTSRTRPCATSSC